MRLDEYLARVAQCTSLNQVNRLHIGMENVLAPAEVCALVDTARARNAALPPASQHWLSGMDVMLRGDGRPVQPYERITWSRGAVAYSAPGDAVTGARRRLVIALTGGVNRLMMPMALFLQYCPADRLDFLVLSDFQRKYYLAGVEGLGHDLPSTIAEIRARFPRSVLASAITFGTSAGGFASVWMGVELGVARAVAVGGVTPNEIGQHVRTQGTDLSGFEEAIRRHESRLPEVVLVSGALAERDIGKAHAMQRYLPATHITVPDSSNHNMLYDAWKAGGLAPLLDRLLGDAPASATA